MIEQILLGDAEAERSFELMPQSRVMLGVIECCYAPIGEEKDENLFSVSQLEVAILMAIPQAKVAAIHSDTSLHCKKCNCLESRKTTKHTNSKLCKVVTRYPTEKLEHS